MKEFVKRHHDMVLVISAALFLAALAGVYVFSVNVLVSSLNQAFGVSDGNHVGPGFDFEAAQKILIERGL